jgi:hypothetical protein
MVIISRALITASLLWVVPALAQPVPDHDAHHPEIGAAAQQQQGLPTAPPAARAAPGMPGAAMGGGMMGGNMMGQGQAGPAGMMPMMNMIMGAQAGADHIEGRLAFIKAELKITDAQAQQWNAFADAVRGNVGSMAEMRKSMMGAQGAPATLPERLAREDTLVTAHLAAFKKTEEAVARLYAVLTDDQKKVADTIVIGPMGMPMGMM